MKKLFIYPLALLFSFLFMSVLSSQAVFAQKSIKFTITNSGKTPIKVTFRRADGSNSRTSDYPPSTTRSGTHDKGGYIEYYCVNTKNKHKLYISENPKNNVFNISCN